MMILGEKCLPSFESLNYIERVQVLRSYTVLVLKLQSRQTEIQDPELLIQIRGSVNSGKMSVSMGDSR